MSDIKELLESILNNEPEDNQEPFKKLIYLAVNDQQVFRTYAQSIASAVCPTLDVIEEDQIKLLALQLLSEMATNYPLQISSDSYDFLKIIRLLSDDNAEVRKSSHYLLVIFIKKYEMIDDILKAYLQIVKDSPEKWKQIQKIIHSFQSLLVIEPKCVTYGENYDYLDEILKLLLTFRTHQQGLIQKASEQTVSSFVKNQHVPEILPKLDLHLVHTLAQVASKLNINLTFKQNTEVKHLEVKPLPKKMTELEILLEKIQNQADWKVKSDIIDQISKILQRQQKITIPLDLVEKMLDLAYDYNFKICITAMNIIYNLICCYPKEIQEQFRKIEDIMIEKICDLKMAIRQVATKILKKVFNNSSKESLKKICFKLSNCSVVGKEEILNLLQQLFSTIIPIDLSLVLNQVSLQFANENTRIKIKTLDCLVKISLANSLEESKIILQKKLNKVYFDMFLERLREKPELKAEEKSNFNKGMTWQAERPALTVEPNDKFFTKVEFGKKVEKTPIQEDTFYDFKYEAPILQRPKEEREGKYMLGTSSTDNATSHTFQTHSKDQTPISKAHKKNQIYKPTAYSNYTDNTEKVSEKELQEEKKILLKPNPVKKKMNVNDENVEEESNSNLVIQSKQYKNKTSGQEIKEEKAIKSVRVAKGNQNKEKIVFEEEKMSERAKEPFSIKKSSSKKQHQIDYKATQYVAKEELAPVDNPKELLKEIVLHLPKDNDWSKQFDSLDALRRILKNHQEVYPIIYQNLPIIMPEVLKLVDSLRSSLAKNGMITLSELCEILKKAMDPFLELTFIKLFKKCQDANSFIVEEVRKCMSSLCNYCSAQKICTIIINNSQVKAVPIKLKISLCIDKLLEKDQYNIQLFRQNPKIVAVMGNLITDPSVEVRSGIKEVFLNIYANNSKMEVEAMFKKSTKEVWDKWKSILEKEVY